MNDFERALADALKKASDDYRPTDQYAAKERFLHRLRRRQFFFATGGVALAGTAAVIAGFLFFARDAAPERVEPLPPAAALEGRAAEIAVGERPSGVAYGDDSVWVANSADGTVMVIDPATREVTKTILVGGDPDDVAVGVGAAWVSDSGAGTIARVPLPSSGEPLEPVVFPVGEPGSTHMDVAPGADGLWVAKDDSVFRIDPETNDPQPVVTVESPTDIAVGEGAVYVLGETEVARVDPVSLTATHLTDVVPSANQDMGFNDGYLWIANGDAGEVTRVHPMTGDKSTPILVGGNFSGISVDEDAVWVISGGASDVGVLTRIDPDTLAVQGGRAELDGRPYDITTGAGLVWIANLSAGTVSGLHPDALPGGPDGGPAESGDPMLVFSANEDLWVESFQMRLTPLTNTAAQERDPTVSADGRYVAFERGPDNFAEVRVVVRDLETGEERTIGTGPEGISDSVFANWSPSFGPDDHLAVVRDKGGDVSILVLDVRSDEIREVAEWPAIAGYGAPNRADDLVWDLEGEFVYYNAGWEGYSLYQADAGGDQDPFELIPGNHQTGARYITPSVRSNLSVHVVRICCEPTPSDVQAELGIIRFTEGGPQYESIAAVDVGQASPTDIDELASAGNLAMDYNGHGDHRWRHTVVRSWFVSTDRDIWLVDAGGLMTNVTVAFELDFRSPRFAGLASFPEFDD